jgi:hypothetical protein
MCRLFPSLNLLHRLVSVAGILLVLALGFLTVSPQAHAWLHAHGNEAADAVQHHESEPAPVGDSDHACAVTLFAHGVLSLVACLLTTLAWLLARSVFVRPADWLGFARPAYWLVPSHAPPVA